MPLKIEIYISTAITIIIYLAFFISMILPLLKYKFSKNKFINMFKIKCLSDKPIPYIGLSKEDIVLIIIPLSLIFIYKIYFKLRLHPKLEQAGFLLPGQ